MPDNTTLNPAVIAGGPVIRTDEVAGVQFPVSKIVLGDDGVDGGFVAPANPLPAHDAALQTALVGAGGKSLTDLHASLATLQGYVDGLEPLATLLNGYVDGIEALIAATNGYVDGLEALLSGTLAVSAAALPLPAGAATSAKQDTQANLLAGGLPAALGISGGLKTEPQATFFPAAGTLQNAQAANANGATYDVRGLATVLLTVTGTFTGFVNWEVSDDDATWYPLFAERVYDPTTNPLLALSSNQTNMVWNVNVSGWKSFRARTSSMSAGNVTVVAQGSVTPRPYLLIRAGQWSLGNGAEPGFNNSTPDGMAAGFKSFIQTAMPVLYNGAAWDRQRNHQDLTALVSAARTGTLNSADLTNHNAQALHLVIDVTAIVSTPSVVFTVQGKDALSGQYYTILTSAAIVGVGTTILRVFPGAVAAANLTANDRIPRTFRVLATHGNANSITYSVGYSLLN